MSGLLPDGTTARPIYTRPVPGDPAAPTTDNQGAQASSQTGNEWFVQDLATRAGLVRTNAGTTATTALPVQGVTGGVALTVSGTVGVIAGAAIIGKVGIDQTTPGTTNGVQVNNFPATQAVSAAALPLPSGAATAANQATPTAPGTSSTTQAEPVQGVTNGVPLGNTPVPTAVATNGITPCTQATAQSALVCKAGPGNLYDASATSTTAGSLVVLNAAAAPAAGATLTPLECVAVPANGTGRVSYPNIPEVYSVGITFLFTSGGCFTYTAVAAFLQGRAK